MPHQQIKGNNVSLTTYFFHQTRRHMLVCLTHGLFFVYECFSDLNMTRIINSFYYLNYSLSKHLNRLILLVFIFIHASIKSIDISHQLINASINSCTHQSIQLCNYAWQYTQDFVGNCPRITGLPWI